MAGVAPNIRHHFVEVGHLRVNGQLVHLGCFVLNDDLAGQLILLPSPFWIASLKGDLFAGQLRDGVSHFGEQKCFDLFIDLSFNFRLDQQVSAF